MLSKEDRSLIIESVLDDILGTNNNKEERIEELIREAIMSENEAITIYIKLAKKAKEQGLMELHEAFEEIKRDEQVHVGQLQHLLHNFCKASNVKELEGWKEADEQL